MIKILVNSANIFSLDDMIYDTPYVDVFKLQYEFIKFQDGFHSKIRFQNGYCVLKMISLVWFLCSSILV